ncbi:MAG: hypothetical protein WCJ55_20015 [Chloroflexales bacterium]
MAPKRKYVGFNVTVNTFRIGIALCLALLTLASCGQAPAAVPTASALPPPAASAVVLGDGRTPDLPAIRAEQDRRHAAMRAAPYILLRLGLDARLDAAQRAAAADVRVQEAVRSASGERQLAEAMAVGEARAGDLTAALAARCPPSACLRVVMYVYPTNTSLTAVVDGDGQVLDVQSLAASQPEIPRALADLATQIAVNSPETATALGVSPTEAMALAYASATKTSFIGTPCERSQHLCVSPVFTWGSQALWVIIDLTDLRLVGAATWTAQGQSAQRRDVSEATLQDAAIAPLCDTPQTIARAGWTASYMLTSSDGLELRDVSFHGRPLLASAKIVDWHVGYTAGSDGRRVGFSDAVGCPVFSSAAIIPYALPTLADVPGGGFSLKMTFRSPNWPQPCNYQYTFTATFAPDGSLTVRAGSEGRGCGVDGVYHPVLRIVPPPTADLAQDVDGTRAPLTREGDGVWPARAVRGFVAGTVRVTPDWGDADLAYVYWSVAKDAEGEGDLPSIGTCCRLDIQQGPDVFVTPPEPLTDRTVFWYVPKIINAERARCWADMELQDGVLVPHIWPCGSGVRIASAALTP